MSTRTRRRWLFLPALVAMLVGGLVAAPAQAQVTAGLQPVPEEVDEAYDEDGNGPATCNGGAQEESLVQLDDLPTTQAAGPGGSSFAQLPNAAVQFVTPAGDNDQILVTFSAEARLTGQPVTYLPPLDFLQVQILLDGAPMPPLNGDLMFTTDAGQANATQACHRVGPGQHTVRVVWRLVDQAGQNSLEGTLDDWVLHVEINN